MKILQVNTEIIHLNKTNNKKLLIYLNNYY